MTDAKGNVAILKGDDLTFGQYLYNSETGEVLGRTALRWLQLFVFYILFYGWLVAFFAMMYAVFFTSVDSVLPKYTNDNSLIRSSTDRGKVNPGMGFRPMRTYEDTLFVVSQDTATIYSQALLAYYQHFAEKNEDGTYVMVNDKFQYFDNVMALGECDPENGPNSYNVGEPCVVLKLNKIIGWKPDPYDCTGNTTLQCAEAILADYRDRWDSDATLNDVMAPLNKTHGDQWQTKFDGKTVVVSCYGTNPPDRVNLRNMKVFPDNKGGFPVEDRYFPYENQKGFFQPLVAVKFTVNHGALINVRCKSWAKNIANTDMLTKEGQTMFELKVD